MRRQLPFRSQPLFVALCLVLSLLSLRSRADDTLPSTELVSGQLAGIQAEKESLDGSFPGLLLTVRAHDPIFDTRYHQPYRASCCVYVARKPSGSGGGGVTAYSRRFVVHVPDAEALPTAKRVARLLLLLQGEVHSHLRVDHPGRYQTVDVWLTRRVERGLSPDTAGEQFKDQIYLYDLSASRRAVEWARETAHEYGHFALVPGAMGFTAPESDSNGVLGERLFLKWLWADLHAGRVSAEALPFLTPDLLDTYVALQVTPLLRQIAHQAPDARQLARRDAEGMDYYTGLMLYLDTLYGSRQLQDIRACTLPAQAGEFVHAPDFLRGAVQSLTEAPAEALHFTGLSADNKTAVIIAYLPRGEYALHTEGVIDSWQAADSGLHAGSRTSLSVAQSGWHRLALTLTAPPDTATVLHLRRLSK